MEHAERFCRQWDLLPEGELVLCAVSGGRDSMALLHWLLRRSKTGRFRLAAAHYNHRLRPTADRDEGFVRDWCREKKIPLTCGGGDVRAFAKEAKTSLEDAARTLRYRFLEHTAAELGAARIATAHHREDNAETVLLHLLRGSGLRGLCGIAPIRGSIVRPLLETSREEINAYMSRWNVPYVEDETNLDPAYTRNRLRLEVLPLLEEISPGCSARIAAAGTLLREEEDHLQQEAERSGFASYGVGAVTLSGLWDDEAIIGRRRIRSAAGRFGVELDRRSTESVWRLSRGGYLDLSGGLCALREGERLTLRRMPELPAPMVLRPGEQTWGPWVVALREGVPLTEGVPPEEGALLLRPDAGELTIAPWDGRGRLAVENGSRTIKRLFVDKSIPIGRRWEHPALLREGRPVAVFGVAVDWSCRPRKGERPLAVTLRLR